LLETVGDFLEEEARLKVVEEIEADLEER